MISVRSIIIQLCEENNCSYENVIKQCKDKGISVPSAGAVSCQRATYYRRKRAKESLVKINGKVVLLDKELKKQRRFEMWLKKEKI